MIDEIISLLILVNRYKHSIPIYNYLKTLKTTTVSKIRSI